MTGEIVTISIHALREEGDLDALPALGYCLSISIHALREEGDPGPPSGICREEEFLSTPSARRATQRYRTGYFYMTNFYPRPPRGGRLLLRYFFAHFSDFYPRPPRGGRRILDEFNASTQEISIHALREEGDLYVLPAFAVEKYFYPRPPRGGRRLFPRGLSATHFYFYPRPPRGGRPPPSLLLSASRIFLSTPSARRATEEVDKMSVAEIFLSTPSARRATFSSSVIAP